MPRLKRGMTRCVRVAASLLQMLGEEVERARPGDLGALLVVARALVAVEAVLRAVIDEDLAVGATLLLDRVDVGHRNAGILLAEVHHGRRLRLLIGGTSDHAAVIGDRSTNAV